MGTCAHCGRSFVLPKPCKRVGGRGRFCSRACVDESRRRYRDCAWCGQRFLVKAGPSHDGRGEGTYCARSCMYASLRAKAEIAYRQRTHRRKRSRHRDVAIFERDAWRCHLCGGSLRRSARVPHPQAPTIDHLVPRSVGGDDTLTNLAAAHFRCNALRQAGGVAQLRLLG